MIHRILLILAIIPSIWILSQSLDIPLMGLWGDDTIYYSSAQSLAEGKGYRMPSLQGQPFQTKYPPLFPLLLSIAWHINPHYPENLPIAAVLAWIAAPVYLFLAWRLFMGFGFSRTMATVGVLFLAGNGHILFYGAVLMSEIWFSVALLAVFVLSLRVNEDDSYSAPLAGIFAAAAFLIKSSALPLLIALPAGYLWRRRYASAWQSTVPILIAVAGWTIWTRTHATQTTDIGILYHTSYIGYYLKDLNWPTFVNIFTSNVRFLFNGLPNLLMLTTSSSFETALSIFFLVAGPIGAIWLSKRSGNVHYALFAAGYLLQLLSWNFMPTARLLLPLLPLLVAGLMASATSAFGFLRTDQPILGIRPIASLATAALSGALVFFVSVVSIGNLFAGLPSSIRENRQFTQNRSRAYEWIRENTPVDAGILAYDDQLLYLQTNRRSASQIIPALLQYRGNESALRDEIRKLPAYARDRRLDYILVTPTDLRRDNLERYLPELEKMLDTDPGWTKVFDERNIRIYRIRAASN